MSITLGGRNRGSWGPMTGNSPRTNNYGWQKQWGKTKPKKTKPGKADQGTKRPSR